MVLVLARCSVPGDGDGSGNRAASCPGTGLPVVQVLCYFRSLRCCAVYCCFRGVPPCCRTGGVLFFNGAGVVLDTVLFTLQMLVPLGMVHSAVLLTSATDYFIVHMLVPTLSAALFIWVRYVALVARRGLRRAPRRALPSLQPGCCCIAGRRVRA
jgi:hypothetical protein